MFLALAAAAITGGFLVWQWVTNQPNAPELPPPGQLKRPAPSWSPPARWSPELQQRMAQCGASADDWRVASEWSAKFLSQAPPLRWRLERMHNVIPYTHWPAAAHRVWCALR